MAFRQVKALSELTPSHVEHASIWVQVYNIPMNCLTDEGLEVVGEQIGTVVSTPIRGFVGGKSFVKMKILLPFSKPVKDHITITHPALGDITMHCNYEKVSRICTFCGNMGHEFYGCQDRDSLADIVKRLENKAHFQSKDLLAPKFGAWITDPYLILKP